MVNISSNGYMLKKGHSVFLVKSYTNNKSGYIYLDSHMIVMPGHLTNKRIRIKIEEVKEDEIE